MATTISTRLTPLRTMLLTLVLGAAAVAGFTGSANAATVTLNSGAISFGTYDRTNNPPVNGSWVRLYQDGTSTFYSNGSSLTRDPTYTQLVTGSAGILLGRAQVSEGFSGPDSLSNDIIAPQLFDRVAFGVFTTSGPTLLVDDVTNQIVGGDFSTWTVGYGGTDYPTGARGTALRGTVDPTGGPITLRWTADITNGPFAPFTSEWEIKGTYTP